MYYFKAIISFISHIRESSKYDDFVYYSVETPPVVGKGIYANLWWVSNIDSLSMKVWET